MSDVFSRLDLRYPGATHKFAEFARFYEPLRAAAGAFAEFGVYNGSGARALARLAPERMVYAFDTFAGMPAEDYHPGGIAVMDDYHSCAGARRAVDEWVAANSHRVVARLSEGLDRLIWSKE